MDVVVLNCWVTATNEIDLASKASTSLAKSASERGKAVDLVDDHHVDPRGRPRGFDREAALEAAMRLFWSRGYEATSVSDLVVAMGITPPSLYGAFGDKKRLFLEAVDRYQAGPGCFAYKALTEEPTAERAMRRLMMDAVKSFTDPHNPRGCMVILAATNCTVESGDVMEALASRRCAAQAVLCQRIAIGRAAGELAPGADIDALAGLVTATLSGLVMLARDGASRASLRRIVDQMMLG
jgi:TetR/AcrR family transcriptional regulator, copper-responsive repressor